MPVVPVPVVVSVEPVVEPVVPAVPVVSVEPPAPMEVPLPVAPEVAPMLPLEAVLSVLGVVPIEPEPLAVLLVVSDGVVVVDGIVLDDVLEVSAGASSFLLQALRDRAAMRARAAHCAIGDLIIRNSLVWFRTRRTAREIDSASHRAACGSL